VNERRVQSSIAVAFDSVAVGANVHSGEEQIAWFVAETGPSYRTMELDWPEATSSPDEDQAPWILAVVHT
jgi:hypothetical protein